jgi:protease-4
MERDRVEAAAEGRIHSGRRAKELGLVDDFGGLSDALDRAREQGGVSEWAPVERWPRRKTILEAIAEGLGGGRPDERVTGILSELAAAAGPIAEAAVAAPLLLGRERVAVALPFVLHTQ